MLFKNLSINKKWQQFKKISIDFHDRLTILTGANASGKTTLLRILARHTAWGALASLATPEKSKNGEFNWASGIDPEEAETPQVQIGTITYGNDVQAKIVLPKQNVASYNIGLENQQGVSSTFIPSHRGIFRYQELTNIPTKVDDKTQAYEKMNTSSRQRYEGGNVQPSNYHMKETLISWNTFGHGNPQMDPDPTLLELYKGFERILGIMLPETLGFREIRISKHELVLSCESGNFIVDGSSGGLSSLIEMAWLIYTYQIKEAGDFTVIIDEVENHLHPTMQRQILPSLIEAFPRACFIVSTHSPLIVCSVKEANVYALRYNNERKIVSDKLDFINKAKTASEVLDEVLGVSVTMPIWAEEELDQIIKKYMNQNLSREMLFQMRNELQEIGLANLVPQATINLISKEHAENN